MTCRTALAVYLGCALMAAWAVLRAWDHFHGRPPLRPEWPEPVPPADIRLLYLSDNLTAADGGPVSIRWRQ